MKKFKLGKRFFDTKFELKITHNFRRNLKGKSNSNVCACVCYFNPNCFYLVYFDFKILIAKNFQKKRKSLMISFLAN